MFTMHGMMFDMESSMQFKCNTDGRLVLEGNVGLWVMEERVDMRIFFGGERAIGQASLTC